MCDGLQCRYLHSKYVDESHYVVTYVCPHVGWRKLEMGIRNIYHKKAVYVQGNYVGHGFATM